jgi:hypothetical protein
VIGGVLLKYGPESLLLFPCCAEKKAGGNIWQADNPGIADSLSSDTLKSMVNFTGFPPLKYRSSLSE